MKTSCLLTNLDKALSIVGRAVASRSTLPVLSHVLLATENGRLKLSATDLNLGITCWIGAKVDEEGAVTVPARTLIDLVGVLPDERVDMALDARTQTLNLKCGRFENNLRGIDASEFPALPGPESADTIRMEAKTLHAAINQVVFAAATTESRPILTGVFARFENDAAGKGQVTLAAADGFRLAVRTAPLLDAVTTPLSGAVLSAIIPARALSELGRILGDQARVPEGQGIVGITLTPSKNQVLFHLDDVEIVSQLIDGKYPDYAAIVPTKKDRRVVASTAEMLKACKAANVFARESQHAVKLTITPGAPGQIVVQSTSAETGDNVGQVDATVEGDPLTIAFDVRYLVDVLNVARTEQIAIETTTPSSPGKFLPVNDGNLTCVVMPMHLGRQ